MEHNLIFEHFNQATSFEVGFAGDKSARIKNLINNSGVGKVSGLDTKGPVTISFFTLRKNKPAQSISYVIDRYLLTEGQMLKLYEVVEKQKVNS